MVVNSLCGKYMVVRILPKVDSESSITLYVGLMSLQVYNTLHRTLTILYHRHQKNLKDTFISIIVCYLKQIRKE